MYTIILFSLFFNYFLKYKFIYFNWRLITLQYCIGFAIHQYIHICCMCLTTNGTRATGGHPWGRKVSLTTQPGQKRFHTYWLPAASGLKVQVSRAVLAVRGCWSVGRPQWNAPPLAPWPLPPLGSNPVLRSTPRLSISRSPLYLCPSHTCGPHPVPTQATHHRARTRPEPGWDLQSNWMADHPSPPRHQQLLPCGCRKKKKLF